MCSKYLMFVGSLVLTATLAWSQTPSPRPSPSPSGKKAASQKAGKTAEPPKTKAPASAVAKQPGFDIADIDNTLDPCTDFYAYSCSKWMKSNPIPSDYPEWVSFSEV